MAKYVITITIDNEGNPQSRLAGYQGKGCQAVQDAFGRAFGKTTKVVNKPEFNKLVLDKLKGRC